MRSSSLATLSSSVCGTPLHFTPNYSSLLFASAGESEGSDTPDTLLLEVPENSLVISEVQTHVVLQCDDLLGSINESHKDPLVGSVLASTSAPREVPGVPDHQLEVVVTIYRGRDIPVVLHKLLPGDDAIMVDGIELGEEVIEGPVWLHVSRHDFRVMLRAEQSLDVASLKLTHTRVIHGVEGLLDEAQASFTDLPANCHHELVEGHELASILLVQGLHQHLNIAAVHVETETHQASLQLSWGNGVVPVGVHDGEGAAKGVNTVSSTTLQDQLLEFVQQNVRQVHLYWCRGRVARSVGDARACSNGIATSTRNFAWSSRRSGA
mmetsp:Transcript_45522/g.97595  ORF Transcript_45522/g.97595 Transcript_45522/m.97595 type:complete len:323 (+) Transcript_45522:163-1131(+)